MRVRRTFRTSVLTIALAIFAVTAACPGQCVSAAPVAPVDDCHGHEEAPAPDGSTSARCCSSILAIKASADAKDGSGAPVLLPVPSFVPRSARAAHGFARLEAAAPAPPMRALYLRSHALLI